MNLKEFNQSLAALSSIVKPLNQLLYQSFILIVYYYIFECISFSKYNKVNYNIDKHKSFIYLFAFLCIIFDWFVWNNSTQTILFISISIIYITYSFNKSNQIATFINYINNSREINIINDKEKKNKIDSEMNSEMNTEIINLNNQEKLEQIIFIPNNINLSNNKKKQNPKPYNFGFNSINAKTIGKFEINDAYSSSELPTDKVFNNYTQEQLNNLYASSQYKNIRHDSSNDTTLIENENTSNDDDDDSNRDRDLFRKPINKFLDDKWLKIKDGTYNDNCKSCKLDNANDTNNDTKKQKNKNAICYIGKFGKELAECTNQEDTINSKQLQKISNSRHIEPIYKF
jgi:hypothetical protein